MDPVVLAHPAAETSILSDELLRHAFSYLDAATLTLVRLVSSRWCKTSDESDAWRLLCAELWEDKQFHPLEQWVRLPPEPEDPDQTTRNQIELVLLQMLYTGVDVSPDVSENLANLLVARLMTEKRRTAPISRVLVERKIALEEELLRCEDEQRRAWLTAEISRNIRSPISVSCEDLQEFRSQGLLLTWRESFIASVVDSSRCCLTYGVVPWSLRCPLTWLRRRDSTGTGSSTCTSRGWSASQGSSRGEDS